MSTAHPNVSFMLALFSAALVACSGGSDSPDPSGDPGGDSSDDTGGSRYQTSFATGDDEVLRYSGGVDLRFSAPASGTRGTEPTRVRGVTGYTRIAPRVGTSARDFFLFIAEDASDPVVSFGATFVLDPANEASFLAGAEVDVGCALAWQDNARSWVTDDDDVRCVARLAGAGYLLTVQSARLLDDNENALAVSGSVTYGPAPTQITSFTPSGLCSGSVCLVPGTDPDEDDDTGFCLPHDNRSDNVAGCVAGECPDGGEPIGVERDGETVCLCLEVCGQVDESGEAAPVCDPAYGCIYF